MRTARPIWQDARKTSRRAQRLRGSLPSGCHGRHDDTGRCRISGSGAVRPKPNGRVRHRRELRQPADMMHYATGQTGRVPGTSGQKLGPLRPETDLKTGLAPWARPSQAGNSLGTGTNFAQPIILAYGTCASAKIAAIRSLCGRRWLRGTLVWRVRRCERASFMACGRSGRLTPKVYEARARAIDAFFDVTPGESVGMLSALKGFGGCVGITKASFT